MSGGHFDYDQYRIGHIADDGEERFHRRLQEELDVLTNGEL